MAAVVVSLADLDLDALALAGGKAVNLARLLRAGLPVPPGFCITTEAYSTAAAGLAVDDPQQARALLGSRPVPDAVAAQIVEAYRELSGDASGGSVAVAVRSSATAEDLPFASFAGQQDTVLNVVGDAALLAAVQRCWASLWTDRAVAYRAANDIDPGGVRLAVVVQRMVDAAAAGVMFTADPLTGRRGHAVVDAAPGLGEAVVSGAVNPDHFVVATRDGTVLQREVHTGPEPCLSEEQLRELARLAQRVEAVYDNAAQDTEFAVDVDGRVWLLQARAITTLFPLPADAPPPDSADLRVYFSVNVAQGVLRPLTPLGVQALRLAASGLACAARVPLDDPLRGPQALKVAGDRLFFDVTPVVRSRPGRRLAGFAASKMEARSAAALRALVADPRLAPLPGWSPRAAWRVATLLRRGRVLRKIVAALRDPAGAAAAATKRLRQLVDAPLVDADAPADRRLTAVRCALVTRFPAIVVTVLPLAFTGMAAFAVAFRTLGRKVSVDERDAVRRSLPHNPTTQMDLALWELADRVRADAESARVLADGVPGTLAAAYGDGALPMTLQQGLRAFLTTYGHRGVAEIDLGLPRWSEAPAHVLGVLANYLRREDTAGRPDQHFRAGAARAEALVEELAARVGPLRGKLVRFALGRGRELAGLREVPKDTLVALTARLRNELLMPLGVELAAGGRLPSADDLFFLDLQELRDVVRGADLTGEIRARRARYDAEIRRRRVPRMLLSDGTEPAAAQPPLSGALRGAPASAGIASGPARVVLDPVGARLEPGEILVAPSTDPGWTPLFLTAGGLVMEMGGAMSHGAVVAREYGIPAVVGVPGATERISTGERITVDGAAGTVSLDGGAGVPAVDPTWQPPVPGSTWVRRQVVEHMPGPLSPLFEGLYLPGLERSADLVLRSVGMDFSEWVPHPFIATVNGFAYSRGDIALPPSMVPKLLRAMVQMPTFVFANALNDWRDDALPAYLQTVERWTARAPGELADDELLEGIRELAWADAQYWFPVALVVGAAKVSEDVLNAFLHVALRGRGLTTGRFLRGFPSKTLQGDAALEALAARVRSSDVLRSAVLSTDPRDWHDVLEDIPGGRDLLGGVDAYFREFGHQIYTLDFAEPTPADEPEPILRSLQRRVTQQPRDVLASQAALARARDDDVASTVATLDPLRRRAFLRLVAWAQRHAPGREESLFYLGAAWPALRRLARELGTRLVNTGALEGADDVFYLEPDELRAALADGPGPTLVQRAGARRALQEQRRLLHPPAAVPPTARMRLGPFDLSSRETQRRNPEDAAVLSGFAVSPGQVTAPASVVLGPEQFASMTPGSILVCPTTSPAWTPLFGQARGLVTDIGGVLAHGSIVAREYGIPAVMGTGNATVRIRSGQLITVDGDRGVVELASDADEAAT